MSYLPTTVYGLCFLASVVCLVLLARAYLRTRTKLLLWSALSFVWLALNNLLIIVDLVILPVAVDLSIVRLLASLIAVSVLIFGFVWEAN